MDKINKFLKKNYQCDKPSMVIGGVLLVPGREFPKVTKRLECKDGFSISVQANEYAYCMPRDNKAWPYSEVELGYPSEVDDLIEIYGEEHGTTQTVYPYVPIDIVNALIKKHGGIANL